MNLALPAVLLLLIVLPGFLFVYTYRGRLRPQADALVSSGSMSMGWGLAFLLSPLAHTVWVVFGNHVLTFLGLGLAVDLDAVAYLLAGEYGDSDRFAAAAQSFTSHPLGPIIYFGTLYLAAGLAGYLLHTTILARGWDKRVPFLKFNNKWHYLFSGDGERVDGVWVTVTCQHQGCTVLYAGVLESYDFASSGDLVRLVLSNACRREFGPTVVGTEFSDIVGDRFIVWCRDVNTLNIDWVVVSESSTDDDLSEDDSG